MMPLYSEDKFFTQPGFLYPYDVRYEAADRACCNPLPDGRVQFRLRAEPTLVEAVLVYNDGSVKGAPMEPVLAPVEGARARRFAYWEATIHPARRQLSYSFAFRDQVGRPVYYGRHGIDHSVEPLDRWRLDLDVCIPFTTPEWMHGALAYQIFPDRFANGDPTSDPPDSVPWGSPPHWFEFQGGDLRGIIQRLDYLQELGVEALYLNPIFTSPSNHKYDTADYYHVDPALGGDEALHALVEALHERGVRIILDASFNHCHPRFFAFQDVVQRGVDSPYVDWFTVREFPIVLRYRPALLTGYWQEWVEMAPERLGMPTQALEAADVDGPPFELSYLAWYDIPDMPKLNQSNPETRRYFLDVTAYWLAEFEIDGWRMDVARHVEQDFWREFQRVAKETRPDCYLLAEIWGDTSAWLQGDQFDATMNYILRDLALGYLARETLDTPAMVNGLLDMLSLYASQVTGVTYNLISSHDTERFLTLCDGNVSRLKLATLLQLTLPGAPGIYYGDEVGLEGGHDPDCRRAFPWDRPESWRRDMLDVVRQLAWLRRDTPALRRGDFYLVWQGEDAFAFLRRHEEQRVLVVINRGGGMERLPLAVGGAAPQVLWGEVRITVEGEGIVLHGLGAGTGTVIGL
jgi:cyclomaltodextrinase